MLAHHWKKHGHKLTYPCIIQPKLDGVRCLATHTLLQSRDEHIWNPNVFPQITESLQALPPNLILDGELYLHGQARQWINGACNVKQTEPTAKSTRIEYHVFDLIDVDDHDTPQIDRLQLLQFELSQLPNAAAIRIVPSHPIQEPTDADHWYQFYKDAGYEGIMYRANEPYGQLRRCGNQENRWDILLKRKDKISREFQICDVFEEISISGEPKGRAGGLTLVLTDENNQRRLGMTFNSAGLTDAQKEAYWKNPPIGLMATIEFDCWSTDSVPLQPSVTCVHHENPTEEP